MNELRQLFRYLQEFRSLYELEGIEEVTTPSGNTWSLWDLEYLYERSAKLLTPAQYRAITLFLVNDIKEQDAAEMMGVSRTNPIGMYAALGLSKLVEFIDVGGLERFRSRHVDWQSDHYRQALGSTQRLAGRIKEATEVTDGDCWRFLPALEGIIPRIRLKSRAAVSGFFYVHPLAVMYVAHGGYIPGGYTVRLRSEVWEHYVECHLACVNYEHARLARLAEDPRRSA